MPETPNLDALAADQHVQFAELEARLVDEYGVEHGAAVHRAVEEERGRFTEARIHVFVPILVERSVRTRLGARAQ